MTRRNFRATTALGLCLVMAPLTAFGVKAQSAGGGADLFVPAVRACIDAPGADACQPVREDVIACSGDLTPERCEGVLADAGAVFGDPEQMDLAQATLVETREAMDATMDTTMDAEANADDLQDEGGEVASQSERAEPEPQTEDLTEAAPQDAPLIDDVGLAEPEAEPESDSGAELQTADPDADSSAEERLSEALEAEESAAETDAEAWAEPVDEGDAPPESAGAAPVDQAADADLSETGDIPPEAADSDAPDAGTPEPAGEEAATDEAPAEDASGEAPADEAALEEERARLRAEAEAMATEEPELVIEEAPAEDFVAEDEAPRELDAEERSALDQLLEDPDVAAAVSLLGGGSAPVTDDPTGEQPSDAAAAARAWLGRDEQQDGGQTGAEAEQVIEDAITADEVRSSREDFDSRLATDFDAGQARSEDRRRDLERAGLVALGALAVGMMINQNRVVARSDERVVVVDDQGEYAVWRDDDVILRQEGTERRIERYADGSSLSRWDRPDGSQIITIRDATGRVLLRERVLADGRRVQLVDDTRPVEPVDVSVLPPPRSRELRLSQRTDPALALEMLREAEADARALERGFTLRQIRELREVRELVPVLSTDPITFQTSRANVRAEEAPKLAQIGRLMERLIADNPRALFLIEGHTDATGPASYNLALSDRRAESVALALTEFFEIPPENLIIQGYGERHLRIPTAAAEERNRRVAIRHITPLLDL
ncbi:MAG TPA: OmpA family protein [Paracoccus sp.]|nr:OmpA family protein [Paracoccus sp. (in: a-proteobacteria)]